MTIQDTGLFDPPRTACPLCGSAATENHHSIDRAFPTFKVDRCLKCGFIFMNPAFTDAVIRSFYSEDYYTGRADYSYVDERKGRRYFDFVYNARIKSIHRYVKSGSFLDVGASFGGLMKAASAYYSPFGIELSPYSSEAASEYSGGRVHTGTLEDCPFEQNFFSVITMIEVIEHIKGPAAAIRSCFSLLRPGGVLVIQTANMAGRQARIEGKAYGYYLPGHLSYFTKSSLSRALKTAGFSRIKVFHPVDFGLIPKLKKSRGSFNSLRDYSAWFRIAFYHLKSKIRFGSFCLTSSMTVYAFKDKPDKNGLTIQQTPKT